MDVPEARGDISAAAAAALSSGHDLSNNQIQGLRNTLALVGDVLRDDDLQIALCMLYELHYRDFDDAAYDMEWSPGLISLRGWLERAHEAALRRHVGRPTAAMLNRPLADVMFELAAPADGPDLSGFMARTATAAQYRELLIHRTAYHSKEADPYTWVIPRLTGEAKSAMVEIQSDEYGNGRLERMHQQLFNRSLRAMDLDDSYGAYVDDLPATTLAAANTVSFFGLNRRMRGALAGHFGGLEMTSSIPNRKYGNGLRRLGYSRDATWFFDEHVEADAVHEQLAVRRLCEGIVKQEPALHSDVLFGAMTYLWLEDRVAESMISAWTEGVSSLRQRGSDRTSPDPANVALSLAGPT